jgi:hypothetical protein
MKFLGRELRWRMIRGWEEDDYHRTMSSQLKSLILAKEVPNLPRNTPWRRKMGGRGSKEFLKDIPSLPITECKLSGFVFSSRTLDYRTQSHDRRPIEQEALFS